MTALIVLLKFLSHAGQIKVGGSFDPFGLGFVLKLIVIKDLRDSECLFSGVDAEHNGDSFGGFALCELFMDGVSDGTQNEGKVGLADFEILASRSSFKDNLNIPSHRPAPSVPLPAPLSHSSASHPHPAQTSFSHPFPPPAMTLHRSQLQP